MGDEKMNNNYAELIEVLKKDERLLSSDGILLKNEVINLSNHMDEEMINLLINNSKTKNMFFVECGKALVFDKQKFNWVINSREFLPDSYTIFNNKIGLIDNNNNYIYKNDDVSLAFPNKDCILEFDSTDETENRAEIYFNEVLAKSEIDTLLDNKVFVNATKITKNGEEKTTIFSENENLVIKGNNLLSMYSLLPRFKNSVKLMYWDILYNTNNDTVPYNDSFKHSSWLVMMKNRLEIAKKLMADNSVICLQCDKNEDAYLKVLCDEIFGRDNFVNSVSILSSTPSGIKLAHRDKTIIKTKDTLLVYKKGVLSIKPQYTLVDEFDTHFNLFFDRKKNIVRSLKDVIIENGIYDSNVPLKDYSLKNSEFKKFLYSNADCVFQTGKSMPEDIRKVSLLPENKDKPIAYNEEAETQTQYAYNGRRMSFLTQSMHEMLTKDGLQNEVSKLVCDFWGDIDYNNSQNEGDVSLPAGKKPEQLLYRIIDMFTEENDLILDAYFGSGTTGAVAHKMNRRYIGIEQLDRHIEKAYSRLKNVIDGEQKGISKLINWQGGGSFTYFELAKNNMNIIDEIKNASANELDSIYKKLTESPFLNYRIDKFILAAQKEEFCSLEEKDKRDILTKMLDKNLLYVNYSDMEDEDYNISEEDKKFNYSYYDEKR